MTSQAKVRSTARRPQAERRAESDRRMMRAAIRLVAEHGSVGVSLAQIGLAAGYSRGLPSERFGSKIALLEAMVDFSDDWFQRRLEKVLAGKRGLEAVRARINAHIDGARETAAATLAIYQLYMESMSSVRELQPRMSKLSQAYREGFRSHLEDAIALGEIRDDLDLDQQAMLIVGTLRGVVIQALIDGRPEELDAARSYLFEMFVTVLRKKDGN